MERKIIEVIIAVVAIICGASQAHAPKGESCFGIQAGFTTKHTSATIDLFYQYGLSNRVRITPEVGFILRHKNMDAFRANVNVHYTIDIVAENNLQIYPIAGLNFTSWNLMKIVTPEESKDVSTRSNKFGFNLGAGFQMKVTRNMKLKFEPIYTFTSKYSTFTMTLGIGYVF